MFPVGGGGGGGGGHKFSFVYFVSRLAWFLWGAPWGTGNLWGGGHVHLLGSQAPSPIAWNMVLLISHVLCACTGWHLIIVQTMYIQKCPLSSYLIDRSVQPADCDCYLQSAQNLWFFLIAVIAQVTNTFAVTFIPHVKTFLVFCILPSAPTVMEDGVLPDAFSSVLPFHPPFSEDYEIPSHFSWGI